MAEKITGEELRLNLAYDDTMHMRAHEGIYNSLYLRYEPVTGMLCIFLSLEHEQYGTVHIVMYDAPDAFKSAESLRRAWSWRAHTDYISLAAEWRRRQASAPERRGFANMEIEDGSFPHGGCKRILTYLDANGSSTIRRNASQVHISERGTDGTAVFEKIKPYQET